MVLLQKHVAYVCSLEFGFFLYFDFFTKAAYK